MSHVALYRKWRPTTFSEVCGQNAVTAVLSYQVKSGKTSHAYLFCGSRGTGKTSCAKILAKAVNCLHPAEGNPCGECEACRAIDAGTATDVVEMDAASNNGVEYIRDIREEVVYAPAMLKNRVYIIDEVHMLSVSAFNALLKTLEEPPERVVFILATTELHKIPPTILSRCQRFDFRRLSAADITARLRTICAAEGIDAEDEGLLRIARLAAGGMRDAISMLELCAASGKTVTAELVGATAGVSSFDLLYDTVRAVCHKDCEGIFAVADTLFRSSRDPAVFLQDLIGFYRDMLVVRASNHPERYLELSEREEKRLRAAAAAFPVETILFHSRLLDDALASLSRGIGDTRLILETALLRLTDAQLSPATDGILARLAALEQAMASGTAPRAAALPSFDEKEKIERTADQTAEQPPIRQPERPPLAEAEDAPPPAREASAPTSQASAVPSSPPRPIPDFIEAVKALEKSDMSAASILRLSRATLADHEQVVTVEVENAFYAMMLGRDSVKQALLTHLRALPSLHGVQITDVSVKVVEQARADGPDLPDLDELS